MRRTPLLLLLFAFAKLNAQTCDESFYLNILTNSDSTLDVSDMVALDNGDVIVSAIKAAEFYSPILIKLNGNGQKIWQKAISMPGSTSLLKMIVAKDGNIIATGIHVNFYNTNILVKLDTAGNVIWRKTDYYNTTESAGTYLVREDDEGNIYTVGFTVERNLSFQYRFTAQKYDSSGNIIWSKIIGGGGELTLSGVSDFIIHNGACYLVGFWYNNAYNSGVLVKVNSSTGMVDWTKLYDFENREAPLNTILPINNGFLLLGKSNINAIDTSVVIKTDLQGRIVSTHFFTYPGIRDNERYQVDETGNVYYGVGFRTSDLQDKILLGKFNAQSGFEWSNAYELPQGYFPRVTGLRLVGGKIIFFAVRRTHLRRVVTRMRDSPQQRAKGPARTFLFQYNMHRRTLQRVTPLSFPSKKRGSIFQ